MLDRQGLHFRAAFLQSLRSFFIDRHFLEVDTPLRQPVIIPEANIEPVESMGWLLQSSPELCMKRLLAAGCERIFQICPCFRKGEAGRLHLEEFTMLEWYRRGEGYTRLMADCEDLLRFLFEELQVRNNVSGRWANHLDQPWQKLTVAEAFENYSEISLQQALAEDLFDEVLVERIEPHLGVEQPLFLCDYPRELGSLARAKNNNQDVVERFELYINGVEIANGFSELTDSHEQRQRFETEVRAISEAGSYRATIPERFLEELDGIGPAAGIALGVDRLCMLLMGRSRLSEVVSFVPEDY
ncbi:MAG: EF-P lysine aminoacylase EpmA [Thermodesulfobacteriota bacterium]